MKLMIMILMIYNMNQKIIYIGWNTVRYITYFLYFITVLYIVGFIRNDNAKNYLVMIDNFTKIFVSLFLMWKFNRFRTKIHFTNTDRSIVFHCALFLFLTTSLNGYLVYNLTTNNNFNLDYIKKMFGINNP